MGQCIKCKKVFSTFDMYGKICKGCATQEDIEEYQNSIASQSTDSMQSKYTVLKFFNILSIIILSMGGVLLYGMAIIYLVGVIFSIFMMIVDIGFIAISIKRKDFTYINKVALFMVSIVFIHIVINAMWSGANFHA